MREEVVSEKPFPVKRRLRVSKQLDGLSCLGPVGESPSAEVRRSEDRNNKRGMVTARSITVGNHGCLGQNGVTRVASASSSSSFNRQNGIMLNGGKQYAFSPFHEILNASTFQQLGCGNQLTSVEAACSNRT